MECQLPCCFAHHPKFLQELNEFVNEHCNSMAGAEEAIGNIERLLISHFYHKILRFTPKHLGPAQGFSGFSVYWIHLVIPNSGLSLTQLPKAYFYKSNEHISFLCLDSHIQNYRDSKLRTIASGRLYDVIEMLKAGHT